MTVTYEPLPTPSPADAASQTVDGFWDMVDQAGEDILTAINDVVSWLYDMVDGHIDEMAAVIGAAAGATVGGPLGGLVGGAVGYVTGGALQDWARGKVHDIVDKLQVAYNDIWDRIIWFARQVVGDPAELYLNHLDYNRQVTDLGEIVNQLTAVKGRVDTYWDGVAAQVYVEEVDLQIFATQRLKANAQMLSVISSNGAVDVLTGWLWLPLQMGRVASEVLGVIAGAFDAGKLLLAEAGPVLEFIKVGLDFILDARDEILLRIEESVRAAGELSSETADVEGFPGGKWPTGHSPEVVNSPGNWDHAPVY